MKFTTNTKPLIDSLNLGIINANVSNFHKKSCIAQITASASELRINLESARICTEIRVKGSGDSADPATIFVGSLLLKQLVSTLESSTVTLEFGESGLTIYSGRSKFTLPKMIDESELELEAPVLPDSGYLEVPVDKAAWRYIKDHQMYAIAMSFIHPVYTRVWIGEGGDVLVGDFDNSLFTHSRKGNMGTTCLVSDTIVNLFNCLPDGSKLIRSGDRYLVRYESDSFTYVSQFTPQYESDSDVGSYNSDIFLNMMDHGTDSSTVSAGALSKFLGQATLLSNSVEDTIRLSVSGSNMTLQDKNVECNVSLEGNANFEFSIEFKTESLRRVVANYGDSILHVRPALQGDEVQGIVVWDDSLTTILAGVEE